MSKKNEDTLKANPELAELVELIRLLTEELGTELELHYTDDELPTLGDTNTVKLLVRSSKVLRRYGIRPPGVVGSLLLTITTAEGNA